MVKIVVIGCGEIATLAHLPALAKLRSEGLVDITGVCDLDLRKAAALAAKFRVPHVSNDWQDLVTKTNAIAISVCLPPGPNAAVSTAAVEAGLHVICEKPPGRNVPQAQEMARAAQANPKPVTMVAFNRRFAPLYTKAMEQSLRFGTPNSFYGRFTRASLAGTPSNTATDWITSDGSHVLDLAVATIGFPGSVSVASQRVGSGPENAWTIQLHSKGKSAILLFNFAAGRRLERFEWAGPGYDVVLELPEIAYWAQQGKPREQWRVEELTRTKDFFANYGWIGEYRAFLAAVSGAGPRPETDFRYAHDFMRLVNVVLNCPSETIQSLIPEENERVSVKARELDSQGAGSCGRATKVHVLQTPQSLSRFFNTRQLTTISEQCALTLRNGEDWKTLLPTADALITGWGGVPLSKEDLDLAKRLKLVVVVGASVKAVSADQLIDRGVLVCNTADAIGQSVAEHCLLLALAGLRSLPEVDRGMHEGLWPQGQEGLSPLIFLRKCAAHVPGMRSLGSFARRKQKDGLWSDLHGQTVGLIGWGCTARHFARLLQPFGCELLICSDHIGEEELTVINARRASLGEVLASAKVISMHKGISQKTKGMLGARELALIKPGSVIVNTARAGLFDEAALMGRLQKGDVVAALDVYHVEPLPRRHPLRKMRNVILSPHNAGSTAQCQQRVGRQALEIVSAWLAHRKVPAITRAQLQHMT